MENEATKFLNKVFFAVTDHHQIMKIKVIKASFRGESVQIETCVEGDVSENTNSLHEMIFKRMYLDMSGNPKEGAVFKNIEAARNYGINNCKERLRIKNVEVASLEKSLANLEAVF